MLDVAVIDDPAAAAVALGPVRSRLLAELAEPASAATLAHRMGIARQKINYHLHALEAHNLIEVADKRQWGGLTERRMVATASSYVVSPAAMGPVAADPARSADRLSASYLIALAARAIREVSALLRRSQEVDKRLPSLSVDTEIHFSSANDRANFTRELTACVADLAARYHAPTAPGARPHRLVILAHPLPVEPPASKPS
ncbi:ArsR/SmtB family transcription factor [Paludibaculum fermentans]|uniref:ArsR/SmtB family transcription factor n=1 Tax=Paludibaculum fermentans TaxID=1473598 RepID=UPI003EBC783B